MKSIKKLFFGAVGMALAATSVSGVAVAGGHGWEPTKPIDFIIMAGKGGGADKMARLMQAIVEKENQKLGKYIGQSLEKLKIDLGKPDEDFKNDEGNLVFVYNTKKYGIPCERRFEINSSLIIIGFVSNGCF